jgi:hypothetical protein
MTEIAKILVSAPGSPRIRKTLGPALSTRARRKFNDPGLVRVRLGASTGGRSVRWLGRSARSRLLRRRRSHPRSRSDQRRPRAASNYSGQPGTPVALWRNCDTLPQCPPTELRVGWVGLNSPICARRSRRLLARDRRAVCCGTAGTSPSAARARAPAPCRGRVRGHFRGGGSTQRRPQSSS